MCCRKMLDGRGRSPYTSGMPSTHFAPLTAARPEPLYPSESSGVPASTNHPPRTTGKGVCIMIIALLAIWAALVILPAPAYATAAPPATAPASLTPEQSQLLAKATSLNSKVVALYRQGKFADALPLAQEALEIRKTVLGVEHPDYAQSLHNVAAQYAGLHQYAKAE